MLIFPLAYQGEPRTEAMLARARDEDGDDREALAETHGQVSLERAPHADLRRQYAEGAQVRHSDPATSQRAAQAVSPGLPELEAAILATADRYHAYSAFTLARFVDDKHRGRWSEATVRTCVSRLVKAGRLVKDGEPGRSPRGRECDRFVLP